MTVEGVGYIHIQDIPAGGIVGEVFLARIRLKRPAVQAQKSVFVIYKGARFALVGSKLGYLAAAAYQVVVAAHGVASPLFQIAVFVVYVHLFIARVTSVPGEQGIEVVIYEHVICPLLAVVGHGNGSGGGEGDVGEICRYLLIYFAHGQADIHRLFPVHFQGV